MTDIPFFEPYKLSPLDNAMISMHAHFFISFRLPTPVNGVCILEKAISELVAHRPYLAGTVVEKRGKKEQLEIIPPSASFLHDYPMLRSKTHRQRRISCLSSSTMLEEDFIPFQTDIPTLYPSPALRFQANVMQDGIILCVCFHHQFMDGTGLTLTLESLSQHCRSLQAGTGYVSAGRSSDSENRALVASIPAVKELGHLAIGQASSHYHPPADACYSIISRKFFLKPERIKILKEACCSQISGYVDGNDITRDRALSEDDIVTALLWLCCCRARFDGMPAKFPWICSLTRVVDIRRLLRPKLPMDYIGNAVIFQKTLCNWRTLGHTARVEHILPRLALRARIACRPVKRNEGEATDTLTDNDHDGSLLVRPSDVSVTSLRKLKIYGFDFGPILGHPCHFDILDNRLEGFCHIHPARTQSEGEQWEIRIALKVEDMRHIESDDLFCWVRGVQRLKL